MVITYTRKIGNIFVGKKRGGADADDTAIISRISMAEGKQTVRTKAGKQAEIRLRRGIALCHGDILEGSDPTAKTARKMTLVVRQAPEKVILAKFLAWDPTDNYDLYYNLTYETPLQVGYVLGEMRKPLSIRNNGDAVSFPIQDNSELKEFEKKLQKTSGDVEAKITREVFVEGLLDESYYGDC